MALCLWRRGGASRKSAWACERPLACIAIVGQERPAFRPSSDFRTLHLEAFKAGCVPVVRLAGEVGVVRLGNVATAGTRIQGKASRHKAMSDGDMQKEVARRREEIEAFVTQAYQQDDAEEAALGSRRGDALPAELARREERRSTMEAAMRRLEGQAQADAQAERQRRAAAEAERARTGNPRRGTAPPPVGEPPDAKAQRNLTDPQRHIMRTNNKGGEYGGNAQASVAATWQIILACDVTDASHDTQQAEPVAPAPLATLVQAGIERPKAESGKARAIWATLENGYYSEAAAQALEDFGLDPSRATGRQQHHPPEAGASDAPATATERMAVTVRTPEGQALYARRQGIVEPVFGQSKAARGCRRCLLRGLETLRGEWRLVGLTHHLRKLWRYGRTPSVA